MTNIFILNSPDSAVIKNSVDIVPVVLTFSQSHAATCSMACIFLFTLSVWFIPLNPLNYFAILQTLLVKMVFVEAKTSLSISQISWEKS